MPSLEKIEAFEPNSQNMKRYLERLEQYFVANNIPEDNQYRHRRRAILISAIGAAAYDTLSDQCSPALPSSKTFNDLRGILQSHFAPKKLVIVERFRFHNCKQAANESFSDFAATLKRLAATCEFGQYLPQAIRDRFVCGLRNAEIQKKLLAEDHDFTMALQFALNRETAERDVADLNPITGVYAVQPPRESTPQPARPPKLGQTNPTRPESACLSCGSKAHRRSHCRFRAVTCHSCGKYGHLSHVCKSAPKSVKVVGDTDEDSKRADFFSASMYTLGSSKSGIITLIRVQGKELLMEVDTGASVSIISNETYNKHFSSYPLTPCITPLHTYTGSQIGACGQIPLIVVQGNGCSLLGRNWMHAIRLNWARILKVNIPQADTPQPMNRELQMRIERLSSSNQDWVAWRESLPSLSSKKMLDPGSARPAQFPMPSSRHWRTNMIVWNEMALSRRWLTVIGQLPLCTSPKVKAQLAHVGTTQSQSTFLSMSHNTLFLYQRMSSAS